MWSAIPVGMLFMIVNLSEAMQGSSPKVLLKTKRCLLTQHELVDEVLHGKQFFFLSLLLFEST